MNKDRKVRRSNVDEKHIVYNVKKKWKYKELFLLIMLLTLYLLKVNILATLLIVFSFYFLLSKNEKVIFEVGDKLLLSNIDSTYAIIIYFDEIINYQIKELDSKDFILKIFTEDEKTYKFKLRDKQVLNYLNNYIGAKKVGK